jgi:hypothetical protein
MIQTLARFIGTPSRSIRLRRAARKAKPLKSHQRETGARFQLLQGGIEAEKTIRKWRAHLRVSLQSFYSVRSRGSSGHQGADLISPGVELLSQQVHVRRLGPNRVGAAIHELGRFLKRLRSGSGALGGKSRGDAIGALGWFLGCVSRVKGSVS